MQAYIGTKIVRAEPMDEHMFIQNIKKEELSGEESNRPGYHVIYPDGYESWSPKEVFDTAYRQIGEKEATVSAESLPSYMMLFDAREEESAEKTKENCGNCIIKDLRDLVNNYGLDEEFGMPDHAIADYIISQLNILGGIWHAGEDKTPDPEAYPETTEETNDEQYASEEG